ncbi:hypothetical protein [Phenylobacterium sp.]|uniref:hypothetical protein n=1 Tax=Phenylobacterium sp. TaxID=1871053 RepID=UPI002DE739E4|nr:hypothetical protein [Phenylobacterium sp.]
MGKGFLNAGISALALAGAIACLAIAPAHAEMVQIDQNIPGANQVGLKAGENHSGEVGGHTTIAGASFTTPASVVAYASGNLIANSATAGSVVPLSFTVCRVNAGTGMVRRARIKTPDTGFAGVTVTLKLYRDSPTNTNGDHGAWLTTESNYLGSMPVTFDQHFSDAEKGIGAPAIGSEINFDCAGGSQIIYGEVVAGGAITPQGAKLMSVTLETLVN